jgi:galactokinase
MSIREDVIARYESLHRHAPRFVVRAPGRANLIGEHTDYNDGFVMPLAVDRAVFLAISPRDDAKILIHSLDFGDETLEIRLDQLEDDGLPHWSKHVRGGWWLLGKKGMLPPGADAAIGVGVIEAGLALLGNSDFSQAEKALMAVEIEHDFIGVPCGVMDQMASAAAIDQSAMLLDCRSLETSPVPIPDGVSIVVMNTMKSRELADSAYAERRQQCEESAAMMGISALRDATPQMVESFRAELGEVKYRRSKHVIGEIIRTLLMYKALTEGDLMLAGELIEGSHASLRDDYEVSCEELDIMSELASGHPACYGARMMGGGFGGCAVGLVQSDAVADFLGYIEPRYAEKTRRNPAFYVCQPSAGSSVTVIG